MSPTVILGIGGTPHSGSSPERLLRAALRELEARGAETHCLSGPDLLLPLYTPGEILRCDRASRLVALARRADAVIIASPGYHGSVSGLVKNAIDYLEDMAGDDRPYLDGRAVGCIAVAHGGQGGVATLHALRTITHALRGWPTPLGIAATASAIGFDEQGRCSDPTLARNLALLADQLLAFSWRPRPCGGA